MESSESEKEAKELLEMILKSVVNYKEDVIVEVTKDDIGILLRCWVSKKDMGWIVGTNGENANAIRRVIKMMGLTRQTTISVKIEEPNTAPR